METQYKSQRPIDDANQSYPSTVGGQEFFRRGRPGAPWPHAGYGPVFTTFIFAIRSFVHLLSIAGLTIN